MLRIQSGLALSWQLGAYLSLAAWTCCASSGWAASPLRGTYVEARTCQVYTGPCFANGEVGSTGKDAIMVWRMSAGSFDGVDLAGQAVAAVVSGSDTLGFNGLSDAKTKRLLLIINASADSTQTAALRSFAMHQTGMSDDQLVDVQRASIEMQFDKIELTAEVQIDGFAHLATRKARPGDCICSNESAYYPPLTKLKGFVPAITIDGEVTARKLGTRWSIPDSRTAYLGTFDVDANAIKIKLASSF
jgi:hypothetical protein